ILRTWHLWKSSGCPPLPAPGWAIGPLPTMAPPLSMVVAGQRRRLVVCVVSELTPNSGHAVWISGGNGSVLQSFAYGASREDGGTVCTVALLPEEPPAKGDLSCHVGTNRTSPARSSSPIPITGTGPTVLPPNRWRRKGFAATPAHLGPTCCHHHHLPSCSLVPQAMRRWQSRVLAGWPVSARTGNVPHVSVGAPPGVVSPQRCGAGGGWRGLKLHLGGRMEKVGQSQPALGDT
uniref:Ig-like domain-containing protein n=1 Tax=Calidris pygmaea TaxID=425635 RepID=A0A8C3KCB8_9CHAR